MNATIKTKMMRTAMSTVLMAAAMITFADDARAQDSRKGTRPRDRGGSGPARLRLGRQFHHDAHGAAQPERRRERA